MTQQEEITKARSRVTANTPAYAETRQFLLSLSIDFENTRVGANPKIFSISSLSSSMFLATLTR